MTTPAIIESQLNNFIGTVVKQIGNKVSKNLIADNPKQTTLSSRSWFMKSGAPLIKNLIFSSSISARLEALPEAIATQLESIAAVNLTYKTKQGNLYITNNTPYIGDLNAGTSPQETAGWVQRSILKGIKEVN
jgi:hypothetical protein